MTIKKLIILTIFLFAAILLSSCAERNSSGSSLGGSGIFSRSSSPSTASVETAVGQMISQYRLGGAIKVSGIREIPNQNAAIADLQFDAFQYATDNEGGRLVEASKYKPPPDVSRRDPTAPLPSMEEMFPPRKQTYNGQGAASLVKYSDGRWVLKEVRWGGGFNVFTVTGATEIR